MSVSVGTSVEPLEANLISFVNVIKHLGMYEHIWCMYKAKHASFFVCHVKQMNLPVRDEHGRLYFVHTQWCTPSISIKQIIGLRDHTYKKTLTIAISGSYMDQEETSHFAIFVCDVRRQDAGRSYDDEEIRLYEEHFYQLPDSNKRAAAVQLPPLPAPALRKVSIATQTCTFECHGYLNKPVNVFRSLIGRETHGGMNRTNVVISLPRAAVGKPNSSVTMTPLETMKAMSRIHNRIDNVNDEEDPFHSYSRCATCRSLFFVTSIRNQCFLCKIDSDTEDNSDTDDGEYDYSRNFYGMDRLMLR
ncbi:ORF4 [Betabaculovirus altermyunipunctae]|uniref:ORF4 n=1 Tax=Betabaculovirus altermyunipunctae TaxID=3051996 RepID=A0A1S5YE88_9BBAC|nr:ORF4 [Betabaculovirus altermyunipunctae]AQQ80274.1 ORF4 [Betabaculovirus altermyunipunctae]